MPRWWVPALVAILLLNLALVLAAVDDAPNWLRIVLNGVFLAAVVGAALGYWRHRRT